MGIRQPLAEVFGFPIDILTANAQYIRNNRLCPFNNKGPKCTKDSVTNPLGVCSVLEGTNASITCPVRFRQDWIIAVNAAAFFFPGYSHWSALTEVRLADKNGQSAGNLDLVIVAQDADGQIIDFGAVEVQAVYISGNVRIPFQKYMADQEAYLSGATGKHGYVRPDYLSSSRKRLVPQLVYKGGILNAWGKRLAVVLQRKFFDMLPSLPTTPKERADIAWMIYDLNKDEAGERYILSHEDTVYTQFGPALDRIATAEPGPVEDFITYLQKNLDTKKIDTRSEDDGPPDEPVLFDPADV